MYWIWISFFNEKRMTWRSHCQDDMRRAWEKCLFFSFWTLQLKPSMLTLAWIAEALESKADISFQETGEKQSKIMWERKGNSQAPNTYVSSICMALQPIPAQRHLWCADPQSNSVSFPQPPPSRFACWRCWHNAAGIGMGTSVPSSGFRRC